MNRHLKFYLAVAMFLPASSWAWGDTYREPKVTVSGGFLVCDEAPKMAIRVDDGLAYLGHMHTKEENKAATGNSVCSRHIDSYIFVNNGPDREVARFLVVSIVNFDRPGWYFFNDLKDRMAKAPVIESGDVKLANENFAWATFPGNTLRPDEYRFILGHGRSLGYGNYLIKTQERALGMKSSTKVIINYCEPLFSSGVSDLNEWTRPNLLSDAQRLFYQAFRGRADGAITETTKEVALSGQ